jgi:hypothetical protein
MSDLLKKIFDDDEHDLLKITPRIKPATPDDRLANSFLEINDFYAENGRIPAVNTPDINERKLGVRLRAILLDDEKVETLKPFDTNNLLQPETPPGSISEIFEDDSLGLLDDPTGILTIRNVPRDIKKADSIARAQKAKCFAKYEQGFKDVHTGLSSGQLTRASINSEDQVQKGRYFVYNGVLAFVEDRAESFDSNGKKNAGLYVIYENGTESNILLRSFARTLYRTKDGARVVPANHQSLTEWSDVSDEDQTSGYIYVLSSLSEEPHIQDLLNLYKIGFTTDSVEDRIRNAETDPTYLMAPVKIKAKYKCFNMNTQKFEHLLHRFFSDVKLDLSISITEQTNHAPSEWYVVPLDVIDRVANLIISGEIVNYRYDSGLRDIVKTD